ncbi:MAG: hypothetical protein LUQ38_08850, partial [Methanotrichaceae archaeon]|nr:hypothetical protein [Methanotrichaceae archaeon]
NVSTGQMLPSIESQPNKAVSQGLAVANRSVVRQSNQVLDNISDILRYIQRILEGLRQKTGTFSNQTIQSESFAEVNPETVGGTQLSSSRNYELGIAGVKSSEHGAIRVSDVSANPSQPAAWEPIKVTVHVKSNGLISAKTKWGLSDIPLTKQEMLELDRIHETPMGLESGDAKDGYWSCTIPGKAAGTYLALSVWLLDANDVSEAGPYLLHWSTVKAEPRPKAVYPGNSRLFIESSVVKGIGDVSIRDSIEGDAAHYKEKLKGNGSINLETLRSVNENYRSVNFNQKKDLVFTGGELKGMKRLESSAFHGGMGASITERYNVNHIDKSDTDEISSSRYRNNTVAFSTDQAFEGKWNIQTQYAKFYRKMKADQQYTGSFQTQKNIRFEDQGWNQH